MGLSGFDRTDSKVVAWYDNEWGIQTAVSISPSLLAISYVNRILKKWPPGPE